MHAVAHHPSLCHCLYEWELTLFECAGRFDRELLFPLPSLSARESILDIHTRTWAAPPSLEMRANLARACTGYCGADLKV